MLTIGAIAVLGGEGAALAPVPGLAFPCPTRAEARGSGGEARGSGVARASCPCSHRLEAGTTRNQDTLLTQGAQGDPGMPLGETAPADTAQPEKTEPTPPPPAAAPPPTPADARDLLMHGSYEQAAEVYERLSSDPALALEARLGLGRCRLEVGRYDETVVELSALEAKESAEWHYLLARLYERIGNYDDVLEHARAAVGINARHAGARLLVGRMLELLGRRDDAVEACRWFDRQLVEVGELPPDAAWVTDAAQGFLRYSVLTGTNVPSRTQHVLHQMLQQVYDRLDRSYWPARIAAADLLREKFNNNEEDGSVSDYQAALRINPNLPEAYVGLGEVALEEWRFEEVEQKVERALQANPHYAPALHLLAKKFLLERRYQQAGEACDRALAINPNDLAAMSLSAAAAACRYDQAGVEDMQTRVAAINPAYAMFHRTMGDALSGIRQYAASETEYLKAGELDPTDANARTELGMMYMQWGLEDKARDALDAAWALDPYNQRTKFTLELLDLLQGFARHETEHFVVRYDDKRDPGLGEYVADYLESIYGPVTGDYETPLDSKTIIEFFPTHRQFGVRITGKPWIHTVGACTGRVIALATPRDSVELAGRYSMTRVLRHEFVHTVTLAATNNRIPHWFTEGLAVYQEDAPRSFEWTELLADAVRRDQLFTLESIDWGFIRPKRASDRQTAYAQSEWMCEYIVERFGYGVIQSMLNRFRSGETQFKVFIEQLGIEPDDFDRDFHAWAKAQAGRWGLDLTPPENVVALRALAASADADAAMLGRLARAEADESQYEAALKAAHRALELDENEPNALKTLVRVVAELIGEVANESVRRAFEDELLPAAERLLKVDPDGWTAPKVLGTIALRREEWDRAVEVLKRLQHLCPMDPLSWRGLAGIYLDRGDDEAALPQLLELARIEQDDPDVPGRLATIVRRRGNLREAQYWYGQALFIDPFSADLHEALGDTCMQIGDTAAALREYRMLTLIEPGDPKHFEAAALAANKLGDTAQAADFARRAVELNPASSVRSLIPD